MTAAKWDATLKPHDRIEMLWARQDVPMPRRKLRLFLCACCRYLLEAGVPDILGEDLAPAVYVAEQLAVGGLTVPQAREVWLSQFGNPKRVWVHDGHYYLSLSLMDRRRRLWSSTCHVAANAVDVRVRALLGGGFHPERAAEWQSALTAERAHLARLLGDLFGNPFRPVAFDARWRNADTIALARGIYEDRAFDRLPLLADALMDAGCADEQVIGHCRGEGPHVRGCWVVDLVLGKE